MLNSSRHNSKMASEVTVRNKSCNPPLDPPPPHTHSWHLIPSYFFIFTDSDEKEFEDDPLLQVLRQQRTWVKEQIREVDSVLNEFQDTQQVT